MLVLVSVVLLVAQGARRVEKTNSSQTEMEVARFVDGAQSTDAFPYTGTAHEVGRHVFCGPETDPPTNPQLGGPVRAIYSPEECRAQAIRLGYNAFVTFDQGPNQILPVQTPCYWATHNYGWTCYMYLKDCSAKHQIAHDPKCNSIAYNVKRSCDPPSPRFVDHGRGCHAPCMNGNRGYSTLAEAWEACGTMEECEHILMWNDKKYYLRRDSDPARPQYPKMGMPYSC